jgi:hypothetical protein
VVQGEQAVTLAVRCEHTACRSAFRVKATLAGKRIKCPACGGPILVPRATGVQPESATAETAKEGAPIKDRPESTRRDRGYERDRDREEKGPIPWVLVGSLGGVVLAAILLTLIVLTNRGPSSGPKDTPRLAQVEPSRKSENNPEISGGKEESSNDEPIIKKEELVEPIIKKEELVEAIIKSEELVEAEGPKEEEPAGKPERNKGVTAPPEVNLAGYPWAPMATALASIDDMSYRPAMVMDGKPDTGWLCPTTSLPAWLRLEWRFPVTVAAVRFQPFTAAPIKGIGLIKKHVLEAEIDGHWQVVATREGPVEPGQAIEHRLSRELTTKAIRLVIQAASGSCFGISEIQVLGTAPLLPLQNAPGWRGQWIWCEPFVAMPQRKVERRFFRRELTLDNPDNLKEAWLVAAGFDRFTLWLNGAEALSDISYGGGELRSAKWKQLPVHWFQKGNNVLAARVDDIYEVGSYGLVADLILVGKDGSQSVINTDARWQGRATEPAEGWLKPGEPTDRWLPCKAIHQPNTPWHGLFRVPYPILAPVEKMRVVGLEVTPARVRPGARALCTVTFAVAAIPKTNYGIALRLGQESGWNNHDYELWGKQLGPLQVQTGAWQPGEHKATIPLDIPAEAPRALPATLLVSLPTSAVGLESSLPNVKTDPFGLHFTIDVDRGKGVPERARDFPTTEIRNLRGNPALVIDGRPVAPIFWSSSYGAYRRYSEYASTGVKLFRPMFAGSAIPAPGEVEEYYRWWFAEVDRLIDAALSVDPEIKILPSVKMNPNPAWLFNNPDQCYLSSRGISVVPMSLSDPEVGQVRPSFMSGGWREAGARGLTRLVKHMRAQPYAGSVIGIFLSAGRGGENYFGVSELNLEKTPSGGLEVKPRSEFNIGDFSLAARRTFQEFVNKKYSTAMDLNNAWRQRDFRSADIVDPTRLSNKQMGDMLAWVDKPISTGSLRNPLQLGVGALPMDYLQCYAEAMLDCHNHWAKAVKDASDNRLICGCYYGYALPQLRTHVPGFAGHTASAHASRAASLDFFASAADYDASRRAGGDFWGHQIIDSLRLHNKLFLHEFDTRTYLADIAPKTYSREETIQTMKRDACAALVRGSGWWFLEFAEGQRGPGAREWFIDPEIQALITKLKRIYDYSLTLPDAGPAAEIAVFFHGESMTAQDLFPPTLAVNDSIGRLTLINGLERIGAPFDLYNLADIPLLAQSGRLKQYKMCLFLNPFYLTPSEVQSIKLCRGGDRRLVWLWAPGLAQTGRALVPENVADVTGIAGFRMLTEPHLPVCRFPTNTHPLLKGLPANYELAPKPFLGSANEISPVLYLDPSKTGVGTTVLGYHVIADRLRTEMGAFCTRTVVAPQVGKWTSAYCAIPYLSVEILHNLAREAGVHLYLETKDVLFANKSFVAIHTGKQGFAGAIKLPVRVTAYDVFDRKILPVAANRVAVNVPPYSTMLLYLGDVAKFRKAVEE